MTNSTLFLMLREFDIFKKLSDQQIATLSGVASLQRSRKNQVIYDMGDRSLFVYFVQKGSIKLGMNASSGKTLIKDIVYENSLFGENVFAGGESRTEFAQALKDTTLIKIPVANFKEAVENNLDFAGDVMALIIKRLQMLEERMEAFVFKKARRRIVEFLKRTGTNRGIRIGFDEMLINHGMSHKEIAYLTDTSRQTVARVLGELKRENLIHFNARKPNKILIRQMLFAS